jgi:hypothetical protein
MLDLLFGFVQIKIGQQNMDVLVIERLMRAGLVFDVDHVVAITLQPVNHISGEYIVVLDQQNPLLVRGHG